jgi:2-C-methyl-D-erythritol 4-phosphate cytidylyltransferase
MAVMRNVAVILPAAGSGKRFGSSSPKQFLKLAGVPILERTAGFFAEHPAVSEIIIAVPESQVQRSTHRFHNWKSAVKLQLVKGGKTRQQSVASALAAIGAGIQWIAVHDAVRPLLTPSLFTALLRAARQSGAAIPGLAVTDTLKKVDKRGFIVETPHRDHFVQVQTPQVFRRDILVKAFHAAQISRFEGTDEAMLVERCGIRVRVVPGERQNLKITLPEDLRLAEYLMKLRLSHQP